MGRNLEITPARRFCGTPALPGDKSISHRALLVGALARGPSEVRGLAAGWDIVATREALVRLGVRIDRPDEDTVTIEGVGGAAHLREPQEPLPCLNSGTTARLLAGVAAGLPGLTVLTGDASLRRRPMARVIEPLRETGARLWGRGGDQFLPLCIQGRSPLRPLSYRLPVASAQVKSALLLAALAAEGLSTVEEPVVTRDHTETMLRGAGVPCTRTGSLIMVTGPAVPEPLDLRVPADPSAAAAFAVGAAIHEGSEVILRGICLNPTRVAWLDLLEAMGAGVEVLAEGERGGEPVGTVRVTGRGLHGVRVEAGQVPGLIDELPVLAVAMALAEGPSRVEGAGELRRKESDRIRSLAVELGRFGLALEETAEGFALPGGGRPVAPPWSDPHGDHRIAMALAILGTAATGTTLLREAQWLDISFPGFETVLRQMTG